MINTGVQLSTFVTGLNAEATIDPTLLDVLVGSAQAVIEEERPWMVLRKTNTALLLTTSNTWQTAKSLATITDFSGFYSDVPIRLFDGVNQIEYYRLVPFDRRLEYKDVSNTFVFDEANNTIYFNGVVPFNGTLYINYVSTATPIDLTSTGTVWAPFPSRFLPLIGFYAVGIYKGAVDYDSINKLMLPSNKAIMDALHNAMETWDDKRQMSTLETNDPTDLYAYPRSRAIDTTQD